MSSPLYMLPLSVLVQYLTSLGVPAVGATISTLEAGSTNTPVTTYTDSTGLVQNPNPMTLAQGARPSAQSAAMTAFWVPAGTVVDVYYTDPPAPVGSGLTWSIKSMSGINDPSGSSSLQTLLASPASSNAGGSGPVAGADLVANAMKSYDVFADVRAANLPVLASGQTLTISVQGGNGVNDGLGGLYYWNAVSTATDNGAQVLKPNVIAAGSAGRWIRLGPSGNGAPFAIVAGATTDLGLAPAQSVQVNGNTAITSFGASASIASPFYLVRFSGAPLLTNGAALALPGGANIQAAGGDTALVFYTGSGNWILLSYSPALGVPIILTKTGDQSVANQTALQDDTQLVSQPLVAGATYLAQLRYQFQGVGGTGQGYKAALNFTGGLTGSAVGTGVATSNGTPQAFSDTINLGGSGGLAALSTTGDSFGQDVIFSVASAGVLKAQFAQVSSGANATVAKANSCLIITRIA